MLPHYSQDKTQRNSKNFEAVTGNFYEVSFIPPNGVSDYGIMPIHAKKIGGLNLHKDLGTITQNFKSATRSFAGIPDETHLDVSIGFTLNLNDSNQAYVYKKLLEWSKKIHDQQTGKMGLKKNYVGTILISEHNREQDIYRQITLIDCFPHAGLNMNEELAWDNKDAVEMEVTFRCDDFKEVLK